ncbi:flagellar biogenesis protein FliO [Pelomonas saccharophila]|uniref:Flagellar biogenesis protein FliO n=1 Tax=Roseateles saccharophilus TaxID=304 RepID=A0ABU1YH66_ROSSA|nr:flagellar biosynthetic protein FliO [Roseateles saccharophilus]MDR7268207.1 flagellar biogenesis protein FliO [Roseateles saccharophilus]
MNSPGTAASAAIPYRSADDAALPGGSQWGLAIVLCLAALALMLWGLRRRGGMRSAWPRSREAWVDVLETRSLGTQTQLVVARYAGRRLLLSIGPAGTQCLRDDPDAEDAQA